MTVATPCCSRSRANVMNHPGRSVAAMHELRAALSAKSLPHGRDDKSRPPRDHVISPLSSTGPAKAQPLSYAGPLRVEAFAEVLLFHELAEELFPLFGPGAG